MPELNNKHGLWAGKLDLELGAGGGEGRRAGRRGYDLLPPAASPPPIQQRILLTVEPGQQAVPPLLLLQHTGQVTVRYNSDGFHSGEEVSPVHYSAQ